MSTVASDVQGEERRREREKRKPYTSRLCLMHLPQVTIFSFYGKYDPSARRATISQQQNSKLGNNDLELFEGSILALGTIAVDITNNSIRCELFVSALKPRETETPRNTE